MSTGHRWCGTAGMTQNQGNVLGNRPCVRQTRNFREHLSGNACKEMMGMSNLCWDTTRTQGAYSHLKKKISHDEQQQQGAAVAQQQSQNQATHHKQAAGVAQQQKQQQQQEQLPPQKNSRFSARANQSSFKLGE